MKNHNFVGICIMLMVVLAVQSLVGIIRLGYLAAKGVHALANPQPPAISTVMAYAPIFEAIEPINEPVERGAAAIKAQEFQSVTADHWDAKRDRKPRAKSITQLIRGGGKLEQ